METKETVKGKFGHVFIDDFVKQIKVDYSEELSLDKNFRIGNMGYAPYKDGYLVACRNFFYNLEDGPHLTNYKGYIGNGQWGIFEVDHDFKFKKERIPDLLISNRFGRYTSYGNVFYMEDPRIQVMGNTEMNKRFLVNFSLPPHPNFRTLIFEMDQDSSLMKLTVHSDQILRNSCEKNWCPIEGNDYCYLGYPVLKGRLIHIDAWKNVATAIRQLDERLVGKTLSGSTNTVKVGNMHYCIVHGRQDFYGDSYTSYVLVINDNMQIVQISRPFKFQHPYVEFCQSWVYDKDEKSIMVGYTVMDKDSYVFRMPFKDMMELVGIRVQE